MTATKKDLLLLLTSFIGVRLGYGGIKASSANRGIPPSAPLKESNMGSVNG
ncbi:hypothetical protein [Halobacillus naozhouensis]|uniref:Uncharacterized protein n=1 Tax=Halobacillus naozhouensis TaxID=554880 RepID=A0ABY8IZ08_9BACI|nr:hypothetical protein [Halobacillus naozhouensis]WFT75479.1 hypothetical protein P9989_03515 [Halobacillus naozhouensis]